jgi:hypothetical protein
MNLFYQKNEKIFIRENKKNHTEIIGGEIVDTAYPKSKTRRGRVQKKDGKDICPTLTTQESFIKILKI